MARRMLIGEAARQVGVHRATLRRWDARRLIQPRRDVNNKRVYTTADIAKLRQLAGLADRPAR